MNVRRSAAVCRGQAAASGCASRVDRNIINRLAVRIRETEIQSLFKPATSGDEQAVVVRITTRILEEDLTKLPIGPKEIADINLAIDEISQASDIEGVEIRCPAVQGAVAVVGVCRVLRGLSKVSNTLGVWPVTPVGQPVPSGLQPCWCNRPDAK